MVGPGVSEAGRDLGVLDSSEGVNPPAGDDLLLALETALPGGEDGAAPLTDQLADCQHQDQSLHTTQHHYSVLTSNVHCSRFESNNPSSLHHPILRVSDGGWLVGGDDS